MNFFESILGSLKLFDPIPSSDINSFFVPVTLDKATL